MAKKFCVYGEPGAGKTSLLGTLSNPWIGCTDENTLRLELTGKKFEILSTWEEIQAARLKISAAMAAGTFEHDVVCLDTITATELPMAKSLLHKSYIALGDWNEIVIPAWRDEMLAWLELAKPTRFAKPVDVIFTARVDYQTSETGERFGGIEAPGKKLPQQVMAWMDEVFYIEAQSGIDHDNRPIARHVVHTRRYGNFLCKDGSGVLQAVEEPDLQAILDKIANALANVKRA